MIEKTKLFMIFSFTICFIAYSLLVGKYYDKMHISRSAMVIICAALTIVVIVIFIIDTFFTRHPTDHSEDKK